MWSSTEAWGLRQSIKVHSMDSKHDQSILDNVRSVVSIGLRGAVSHADISLLLIDKAALVVFIVGSVRHGPHYALNVLRLVCPTACSVQTKML